LANSIFKNFDPEGMSLQFNANTSYGFAPDLFLFIIYLLDLCAQLTKLGDFRTRTRLTNAQFAELEERVNDLANTGFKNRESLSWHEDLNSYDFEDLETYRWALHGKKCSANLNATASQILGITALKLVDDAMSRAEKEGITLNFVESLSIAAVYLADAKDEDEYDSRQHLKYAVAKSIEDDSRKRKSEWAKLRHHQTNAARAFVRNEWSLHKDAYNGNKSEFSRTYVSIVANRFKTRNGDPLKVTEKTIRESWLSDTPSASRQAGKQAAG